MAEELQSGSVSLELEVPYRLLGPEGDEGRPLILYLHGFRDTLAGFRRRMDPLLDLPAYHLFVQGPYPLYDRSRQKSVDEWGRAWYLYGGDDRQFVRSMEKSSRMLEKAISRVEQSVTCTRMGVLGYSMGGYLAGYYALSRPHRVDDLVVMGGRIKSEVYKDNPPDLGRMNVLALHGREDESVEAGRQEASVRELEAWGAEADLRLLNTGHRLTAPYLEECRKWLKNRGYE